MRRNLIKFISISAMIVSQSVTFASPADKQVEVTNFPPNQDVTVTNLPTDQHVSVTNLPEVQDVNVVNYGKETLRLGGFGTSGQHHTSYPFQSQRDPGPQIFTPPPGSVIVITDIIIWSHLPSEDREARLDIRFDYTGSQCEASHVANMSFYVHPRTTQTVSFATGPVIRNGGYVCFSVVGETNIDVKVDLYGYLEDI